MKNPATAPPEGTDQAPLPKEPMKAFAARERDGVFCAHAYVNDLFGPGWTRPKSHRDHRMVYRVSFYLYNTVEECQTFVEALDQVFKERSYV